MIDALFDYEEQASDAAYVNIRAGASPPARAARELTERLWTAYQPYADRHFRTEIQSAFDERFWEMYLTCTLLELGLSVSCPKPGPDILLSTEENGVWIEAICPTQGAHENPDRVPDYNFGALVATRVPEEKILIRLRHGIETKFRAFEKYISQGVVSRDDACVIAINGCQIPHSHADHEVSRIARCVLPIGNMEVVFSRDPKLPVETRYQYRRALERERGAEIETDLFFQDRYQGLSAVLYSRVDAGNPTRRLGDDFVLIHNPRARVPVPRGMINRGKEIWIKESDDVFTLESSVHE